MVTNSRPRLMTLALLLIGAVAGLASSGVARASDLIVADRVFTQTIDGPSRLRICGHRLWVWSEGERHLIGLNLLSGAREVVLDLGKITKSAAPITPHPSLEALECQGDALWAAVETRAVNGNRTESLLTRPVSTAPGVWQNVPLPPAGADTPASVFSARFRTLHDFRCSGPRCWLIRDRLYVWDGAAAGKRPDWKPVELPPLEQLVERGQSVELGPADPFRNWQEQFTLATPGYSRILPPVWPRVQATPQNSALLLLDPLRSTAVVVPGNGEEKPWRFGAWGAWEGRWMSPKALARVFSGTSVAIADGQTGAISFHSLSDGVPLGILSVGAAGETPTGNLEPYRFLHPLDLETSAASGEILYIADFKANAIVALRMPVDETGAPRVTTVPDQITRPNLFVSPENLKSMEEKRCLNCHDGTLVHSLSSFLSGDRTHHPLGVEVKVKTDLPLEAGGKIGCATCHNPHHVRMSGRKFGPFGAETQEKRLPGMLRKTTPELCLSCHADHGEFGTNHFGLNMPLRSIAVRDCTQCHQLHSAQAHLLRATTPELCISCHGESQRPVAHPLTEKKLDCLSCHQPHGAHKAESFARLQFGKEQSGGTCAHCHAEEAGARAPARHVTALGKSERTLSHRWIGGERICLDCHDPHRGSASLGPADAMKHQATGATLCLSCHADHNRLHKAPIIIADTDRAANILLDDHKQVSCRTCHRLHGEPRERAPLLVFCASCHGKQAEPLFTNFHTGHTKPKPGGPR